MNKDHSFYTVPNSAVQGMNLSLEAKGLYSLIQTCLEDPDFDIGHFKQAVQANCKEEDKAFDSAWKELKNAGYLN